MQMTLSISKTCKGGNNIALVCLLGGLLSNLWINFHEIVGRQASLKRQGTIALILELIQIFFEKIIR